MSNEVRIIGDTIDDSDQSVALDAGSSEVLYSNDLRGGLNEVFVNSPLQVEAARLVQDLGINASQVSRIGGAEDLSVLQSIEKGSIAAKAIEAGVPISRVHDFKFQSQIDAIPLTSGIGTALKFVADCKLEALKKNFTVRVALEATNLGMLALKAGVPRACAWNVTNSYQTYAYKELKQRKFSNDKVCAVALQFNSSAQLFVLEKTGDVSCALAFHNPYAQRALAANVDAWTAMLINNEYSLTAVLNYNVPANLAAKFTQRCQIFALQEGLMSPEEAAHTTWFQVTKKMLWKNYVACCGFIGLTPSVANNLVVVVAAIASPLVLGWIVIRFKRSFASISSVPRSGEDAFPSVWTRLKVFVSRMLSGHVSLAAVDVAAKEKESKTQVDSNPSFEGRAFDWHALPGAHSFPQSACSPVDARQSSPITLHASSEGSPVSAPSAGVYGEGAYLAASPRLQWMSPSARALPPSAAGSPRSPKTLQFAFNSAPQPPLPSETLNSSPYVVPSSLAPETSQEVWNDIEL